jgi:hypothetical protein
MFARRRPVEPERIPEIVRNTPIDYNGPILPDPNLLRQIHTDWDLSIGARAHNEKWFINNLLRRYLKIGFEGDRNPLTGDLIDDEAYGRTLWQPEDLSKPIDNIWIFLNVKTYKPLLRDDLTDTERLGLYWQNATTIVHEW